MDRPRYLFITGKLAEPALRRLLAELAPRSGFDAEIAVMPITVAALLTTPWIARRLSVPTDVSRVILPGLCSGDLAALGVPPGVAVERGPIDLRDLPDHFGRPPGPPPDLSRHDIEIIAEINHAPRLSREALLTQARQLRAAGADRIDLGCDPGGGWSGVADAVRLLRDEGLPVSIDSFDADEVRAATRAGADLVLSVNGSNCEQARDWGVEVVAIPDSPHDIASLDQTLERLASWGVPARADPILEPIGVGFAASLGRYLDMRARHPDVPMMMGVGNISELSDVDSAGVNLLLAGFCQELGIGSVLTTQVAAWCQSCVAEWDVARRLVRHAVRERVPPKRLDPRLIMLRDPKVRALGPAAIAELAAAVSDRNYRIFAEDGVIHVINGSMHLQGSDPFALYTEMARRDATLDASHAFYLGYELAKAATALTLGKQYTQDRALRWGLLTREETSSRSATSTEPEA